MELKNVKSDLVGHKIEKVQRDDMFWFLLLDDNRRLRFDYVDLDLGLYQDDMYEKP